MQANDNIMTEYDTMWMKNFHYITWEMFATGAGMLYNNIRIMESCGDLLTILL